MGDRDISALQSALPSFGNTCSLQPTARGEGRKVCNHSLQKFTEVPEDLVSPQEVRESNVVSWLTMHSAEALDRYIKKRGGRGREGERKGKEGRYSKTDKHGRSQPCLPQINRPQCRLSLSPSQFRSSLISLVIDTDQGPGKHGPT